LFVGRYSFDDFGAFQDLPLPSVTFRLIGARRLIDLETYRVDRAESYRLGDIDLVVLDNRSVALGDYPFWGATAVVDPEAGTWTLTARTQMLPHVAAARLWDRWRSSPPAGNGEWAAIPVGLREGWVEVAMRRHAEPPANAARANTGADVVLEGRDIADLASFLCAIGEAFRGPGGFFGTNFTSLAESVADQVGAGHLRLHWKDFAVAQRCLARRLDTIEGPMSQLDVILEILSRGGIEVLQR